MEEDDDDDDDEEEEDVFFVQWIYLSIYLSDIVHSLVYWSCI